MPLMPLEGVPTALLDKDFAVAMTGCKYLDAKESSF
jgi:hypothetical protein